MALSNLSYAVTNNQYSLTYTKLKRLVDLLCEENSNVQIQDLLLQDSDDRNVSDYVAVRCAKALTLSKEDLESAYKESKSRTIELLRFTHGKKNDSLKSFDRLIANIHETILNVTRPDDNLDLEKHAESVFFQQNLNKWKSKKLYGKKDGSRKFN